MTKDNVNHAHLTVKHVLLIVFVINVLKDFSLKKLISLAKQLVIAHKFVEMVKDLKLTVMMAIKETEMAVTKIVKFSQDIHVKEAQVLGLVLVLLLPQRGATFKQKELLTSLEELCRVLDYLTFPLN